MGWGDVGSSDLPKAVVTGGCEPSGVGVGKLKPAARTVCTLKLPNHLSSPIAVKLFFVTLKLV